MDTDQTQQSSINAAVDENQRLSKKERRELRREEKQSATESIYKARSLRRIVLWVVAIAAIGAAITGAVYLVTNSADSPNENTTLLTDKLTSTDWARGNAASSVSLIEYGDFQCPACGQYYPIVKTLEQEFGNDVAFSFRHFPLSQIHPNAKAAARAAEAAGLQGKFWEMHDILFERQTEWSSKPRPQSTLVSYAKELGLNTDQFEDDLDRKDIEDKINTQYQSGIASKVNSTPTFFLNGTKLENVQSLDAFRHALAQAVLAANQAKNEAPITQPNESDPNAAKTNP